MNSVSYNSCQFFKMLATSFVCTHCTYIWYCNQCYKLGISPKYFSKLHCGVMYFYLWIGFCCDQVCRHANSANAYQYYPLLSSVLWISSHVCCMFHFLYPVSPFHRIKWLLCALCTDVFPFSLNSIYRFMWCIHNLSFQICTLYKHIFDRVIFANCWQLYISSCTSYCQ